MAVRRIGIDTGGTFTDVATLGRDGLAVHKLPSTPHDPAASVIDGLSAVRRSGDTVDVVHGTTVALNAVLTGNLARTAFVTNKGFEDLIEIGRQERTDLYDLTAQKPQIPVPRRLRFGVATPRFSRGLRTTFFVATLALSRIQQNAGGCAPHVNALLKRRTLPLHQQKRAA